jgi:hypothetical protein
MPCITATLSGGEVDRANQNRFAPSRPMPLVYPWRWLCVRSVLPGQVFLAALVATDIRERLRGVCPRLLCKDRRRLAQCSAPVRPYFPICTVPDAIVARRGVSRRHRKPQGIVSATQIAEEIRAKMWYAGKNCVWSTDRTRQKRFANPQDASAVCNDLRSRCPRNAKVINIEVTQDGSQLGAVPSLVLSA